MSAPASTLAIEAVHLGLSHGPVVALDGVDLAVERGSVLAVLGHNGAGKTSMVRVLSGQLRPTAGTVTVCGIDVAARPREVRRRLGVVGQQTALDDEMTGRDTLELVARLLGANGQQARDRAGQLIDGFALESHADRPVGQWSGGLRRRLDLAAGLVGSPEVVLLDEPTTGLDPVARETLWGAVDQLVDAGTAVLLTTQYLDEADRLADDVMVLAAGRVAARGTPDELKTRYGTRSAIATFSCAAQATRAIAALAGEGIPARSDAPDTVRIPLNPPNGLAATVRALDRGGLDPRTLTVSEPTLDAVYHAVHAGAVR